MDVETILSDAGCEVIGIATSADEAVAKARQSLPDLILMDIRLQGDRDGIDAASEIVRDLKTPIVFVTANQDAVSDGRAQHARPIATVSKPFTRESLLIALAAYRDLPQTTLLILSNGTSSSQRAPSETNDSTAMPPNELGTTRSSTVRPNPLRSASRMGDPPCSTHRTNSRDAGPFSSRRQLRCTRP